ncbi:MULTISPECIES: TspO/MBR family protein [unclassified Enterococcus]|uniref:TspO/MBR family protein n=1 Tax=unclassified Enterococcus TaxID=2608891 RepID=UPI0013EE2045|nr:MULTISPECIES: TspO/MBR family protein [unclassified Enterococcus]
MNMLKDRKFWFCVVGIVVLGFLSGLLSGNPGSYYYSLQLPSFAPPSWLFGPMWTLLYLLMGISLYLLLNHENRKQRQTMVTLFVIQFIFNLLWTFFFFNLKNNLVAAIDITLLVIFLSMLMYHLWLNKRIVSWLMLPYYIWVLFATLLNYSIYFLN